MMKVGRNTVAIFALLFGFFVVSTRVQGQTQTTGDIAGTVTDPTGGVVPGAAVTLKDSNQGTTHETTTNKTGVYHFFLLNPGPYVVSVTASGFETVQRPIQVTLGGVATADIQLTLGAQTQTVTVTEEAPLLKTQNGDVGTTMNEQTVQQIPNSGNDLSYTATLAPGVVANTSGGGLGNFSSFGQSAVANLFTINGMDDNDPFLNLNNTGATNLMLGNNEVTEMSVVQNGYSVAYGGLAGAQINVVTGAGTNQFHGRATYEWNGRLLNANNFFNNSQDVPRSFVNANQWAANIGGPLIKNKLFWYFNTEGIYLVVPTSQTVFLPTDGIATATETNIANIYGLASPQEAFYKNMFNIWAGAKGRAGAQPVAGGGCDGSIGTVNTHLMATQPLTPLFGGGVGEQPCQLQLQSALGNLTHDWYFDGRMDFVATKNDTAYVRIRKEHGVQASYTDAINPLFDFGSDQPEWDGQVQWSHTFGASAVNQFSASGQWYSATFNNADHAASLALFPTTLIFGSGAYSNPFGTALGGIDFDFPQGRNVTQYQVADDFTKTMGNHTLKVGVKFHRNDVTDLDNGINNSGQLVPLTFDAFFMGGVDATTFNPVTMSNDNYSLLTQSFASVAEFPVASYELGGYVEDDWKIKPNLTLILGIRLEHQSNPVCQSNCFAAPVVQFTSLDHNPTIPYNQAVDIGRHQALYSLTAINPEPRFGFAWSPGKLRDTVIRGGVGIFYDAFPDVVVDNFAQNPPLFNQFTAGTPTSPGQLTPGVAGSLFGATASSNSAFVTGFGTGATLADLNLAVPGFVPPALTSATTHTKTAQVQKWSLEVQHSFGSNTSLTVGYVGNHANNLPYFNPGLNVFGAGFGDFPATAADARFGQATQVGTNATSNYNGVFASFQRRFGASQFTLNYTYSRALDYSSNSGNPNVSFQSSDFGASNTSVSYPEDPFHPFLYNYGPADYDVTHYFSANYVWQLPIRKMLMGHGWSRVVDGWQVSGTVFARTGMPFTLVDGSTSASLTGANYGVGETIFGTQLANGQKTNCGVPNVDYCLNQADYTTSPNGFGNVTRNTLRGPGYWNSDFTIMKYTSIPGWESAKFGFGAQFFNVFNHPNFQQPIGDTSSTQFGTVISTVSPATSIYGSGLGADSSPRLVQLKAQFTF